MIIRAFLSILLVLSLTHCSTDIKEYAEQDENLDIQTYFSGNITAWGILQDYSGKLTRQFCVDIVATWEENIGTLDETFYFKDGEVSSRVWTLIKTDKNNYIGTAADVIGQAYGTQNGVAFHWQYTLAVPVDDETYHLYLDDWMYKVDNKRLFNRTSMRKWGVEVADITLFFEKTSAANVCKNTNKE